MTGDKLTASSNDDDGDDETCEEDDEQEDEEGDIHAIFSDYELDLNEDNDEDIPGGIGCKVQEIIESGLPSDGVMIEPLHKQIRDFSRLSEENDFRWDRISSSVESPENIIVETVYVSDLPREMV